MSSRFESRKDPYEVLGVPPRASWEEIEAAYERKKASHLRALASYGLLPEEKGEEWEEIVHAYELLKKEKEFPPSLLEQRERKGEKEPEQPPLLSPPPSSLPPREGSPPGAAPSGETIPQESFPPAKAQEREGESDLKKRLWDGGFLKALRLYRNLSLEVIANAIKVSRTQLEALENHRYHLLPPPVYIKGFLRAYAKFLKIDPEKLVRDYFSRWENEQKERP